MTNDVSHTGSLWIAFALMTVACWGLYGVLLHGGVHEGGEHQILHHVEAEK